MDMLLHQAAQLMYQQASHTWGNLQEHVRLMLNMPPVEVVLTTREQPPRHVAVVMHGSWDRFVNAPTVLKGAQVMQLAMLNMLGYVVVTVDVQDMVDCADHMARAMWLQRVLDRALWWGDAVDGGDGGGGDQGEMASSK